MGALSRTVLSTELLAVHVQAVQCAKHKQAARQDSSCIALCTPVVHLCASRVGHSSCVAAEGCALGTKVKTNQHQQQWLREVRRGGTRSHSLLSCLPLLSLAGSGMGRFAMRQAVSHSNGKVAVVWGCCGSNNDCWLRVRKAPACSSCLVAVAAAACGGLAARRS